ncbi:MAG: DUF1289 domain-containing protein [Paracoccaceae bacterium]
MNENLFISPCIGICTLDQDSQNCLGCGRTKDEISKWIQLSHDERMVIMKRLGYGQRKNKKRPIKK